MKNEKKKIMLFVPILLVFTLFLISSAIAPTTITLNPDANGTYTQFSVVPASLQHWDAVSEPTVNTTDYITSGVNNKTDTFNFQNTNISYVPIDSVTLYARCYRNSSTQNKFYLLIKSGSRENLSTLITGGSSYSTYSFVLTKDPATNQPWTQTGVNNLEGGIRTNETGGGARCAWLYITVQYPDTYEYLAYDYKKAVFTIGGGMNLTSVQDYSCDWGNDSSPWKRCHIITEIDSSRSQFTIRKSMILMNMPIESQNYTYYSTRNYTNFTKNFTTNYRYTNNVSCNSTPYNLTVCDDNNVTTIDTCREVNTTSQNEVCWHVYNITTGYLARSFYNWTEFGDNLIVDPGVSSLKVDFDVPKYNGNRFNISVEGYELDPTINVCGVLSGAGSVFTLNQSVSATGTCFNITDVGITLDCAGYTINFSSSGSGSGYGVYSNQATTTVKNCKINQTSARASSSGIYMSGGTGNISNNTINMIGDFGDDTTYAISITTDSNNVDNNNITTSTTNYCRGVEMGSSNNLTNNKITLSYGYDGAFYLYGQYNSITNITVIFAGSGSNKNGFMMGTNNNGTGAYIEDIGGGGNRYFFLGWNTGCTIKHVFANGTGSTPTLFSCYGCNNIDFINVTTVNVADGGFSYDGGAVRRYWYADAYVNDTSGNPLNASNVSIYNVSSSLINTQLTNTSGYIPTRQTLMEYMQNETARYVATNYSFNATKTGYTDNAVAVNLTTNRLAGTNPVVITLTQQITDTCTYGGSGNWIINCADNCVFTTTQTILTENVTISGTGTLTFNSGGYWNFGGTNQYINIFSGCTLVINSGGGII